MIDELKWDHNEKTFLASSISDAISLLPVFDAVQLLTSFDIEVTVNLITETNDKQVTIWLDTIENDEIINIIEKSSSNLTKRILRLSDKIDRKQISKILSFKDDFAGSIMSNDFLLFSLDQKISSVIAEIKEQSKYSKRDQFYYVSDNKGVIVGQLNIRQLFFTDINKKVSDIIKKIPVMVNEWDDKEDVSNQFRKFNLVECPVIDKNNVLVGVIYFDEIFDVAAEEAQEDIQKLAAIDPFKESYIDASVKKIVKSRFWWLVLLLISATISQIVIQSLQTVINGGLGHYFYASGSAIIALITIDALIPLISGTSGNAGSQASTSVIRSLALGEITYKDYKKVIKKEVKVASIIGGMLVIANFIRMLIYYPLYNLATGAHQFTIKSFQWKISIGISISLFFTVVISKFLGAALPLILRKFKKDPSIMSSPLLTTLVDALCNGITYSICIVVFIVLATLK